jgi:hypothetical protein
LFKENEGIESSGAEREKKVSPYTTPGVEDEERRRLDEYMAAAKPYLDPDFRFPISRKSSARPEANLSWLINNSIGKSFYDYVNSYRVDEALRILATDDRKPILECAYAAGFNVKSTFYKFFRAKTGMSPGEYAKSTPPGES